MRQFAVFRMNGGTLILVGRRYKGSGLGNQYASYNVMFDVSGHPYWSKVLHSSGYSTMQRGTQVTEWVDTAPKAHEVEELRYERVG